MKNKGNRYDKDFKEMIVDLYNTTDHTFKSLESEYGISAGTIQRWVKQFTPIKINENESLTANDFKALQKELAKLKEENEILKKAMAILAKK